MRKKPGRPVKTGAEYVQLPFEFFQIPAVKFFRYKNKDFREQFATIYCFIAKYLTGENAVVHLDNPLKLVLSELLLVDLAELDDYLNRYNDKEIEYYLKYDKKNQKLVSEYLTSLLFPLFEKRKFDREKLKSRRESVNTENIIEPTNGIVEPPLSIEKEEEKEKELEIEVEVKKEKEGEVVEVEKDEITDPGAKEKVKAIANQFLNNPQHVPFIERMFVVRYAFWKLITDNHPTLTQLIPPNLNQTLVLLNCSKFENVIDLVDQMENSPKLLDKNTNFFLAFKKFAKYEPEVFNMEALSPVKFRDVEFQSNMWFTWFAERELIDNKVIKANTIPHPKFLKTWYPEAKELRDKICAMYPRPDYT